MVRDFGSFLRALLREWAVLLTGGGISAALALWSLTGHRAPPQSLNWLIAGLTFTLAAFFSWRREWITTGRGVVSLNVAEVVRVIYNQTSAQSQELLRQYIGKQWEVSAPFSHFYRGSFRTYASLEVAAGSYTVSFAFYPWNRSLRALALFPYGTRVTISGRIKRIDHLGITLKECSRTNVAISPLPPTGEA